LSESGTSKQKINSAVKKALKIALGAAPLYPELKKAIKGTETALFAIDFFLEDDERVQELNKTHRSKDKPTDVLSFPLFEGEVFFFPNEEEEALMLGDMVISIETAIKQAEEQRHELESEMAFLTIHGALHLLGYDHADDKGRRQMFALQDTLFEEFKLAQLGQRKVRTRATSA
jgi:probable rRNA maturation factor